MKFYAGIGSRQAPDEMLQLAEMLAERLDEKGWTLRSGHAPGMDQAFERGAGSNARVYLPWPSFEKSEPLQADMIFDRPTIEAYTLAESVHPNWAALTRGARALHARNCHQLFGEDLKTHAGFVLCWTPDGKAQGGTGQALRLAQLWDVPVFNLADENQRERVERGLLTLEIHGSG